MPDRADYLAKTLLARLRSLETILHEDGGTAGTRTHRREELVEKILAIEVGLVDSAVTQLVLSALPTFRPGTGPSDQEQRELADFLRTRLKSLDAADTRSATRTGRGTSP